jgi:hypothetical protein
MSDDDFNIIPTTDDIKKLIKKNKSTVLPILMVVVILAILGPYYYMVQEGYPLRTIGYYYIAGLVVIFVLFKTLQSSLKGSTKAKTTESIQARREKAQKELDDIEKTLDAEAEIHRKRLAEIEAEKKGK